MNALTQKQDQYDALKRIVSWAYAGATGDTGQAFTCLCRIADEARRLTSPDAAPEVAVMDSRSKVEALAQGMVTADTQMFAKYEPPAPTLQADSCPPRQETDGTGVGTVRSLPPVGPAPTIPVNTLTCKHGKTFLVPCAQCAANIAWSTGDDTTPAEAGESDPGPGPYVEGQSDEWKAAHLPPPAPTEAEWPEELVEAFCKTHVMADGTVSVGFRKSLAEFMRSALKKPEREDAGHG